MSKNNQTSVTTTFAGIGTFVIDDLASILHCVPSSLYRLRQRYFATGRMPYLWRIALSLLADESIKNWHIISIVDVPIMTVNSKLGLSAEQFGCLLGKDKAVISRWGNQKRISETLSPATKLVLQSLFVEHQVTLPIMLSVMSEHGTIPQKQRLLFFRNVLLGEPVTKASATSVP
ncbi:MAG: hypothetical protein R3B53_03675 [Candidatus Paceibacterota bacterium]